MKAKNIPVKPPVIPSTLTSEERLRKLIEQLRKEGFYAIANEIGTETTFAEIYSQNLLVTILKNV